MESYKGTSDTSLFVPVLQRHPMPPHLPPHPLQPWPQPLPSPNSQDSWLRWQPQRLGWQWALLLGMSWEVL